jgi:hypothetical protein
MSFLSMMTYGMSFLSMLTYGMSFLSMLMYGMSFLSLLTYGMFLSLLTYGMSFHMLYIELSYNNENFNRQILFKDIYIYKYVGTPEALTTKVCRWRWRRSEIKLEIGNH